MNQEYDRIITKLKEARATGDLKAERRWKNKLSKWQQAYGAYAPVR
jgi:hypothetical protein